MSTQGQWLGAWPGNWFGGASIAPIVPTPSRSGTLSGSGGPRRRGRRRIEWPPVGTDPTEHPLEDEEALLLGIV